MLSFHSLNEEKNTTIILLHGGLSCHLEYAEVIPSLEAYHILLPDLPAHSASRSIPLTSLDNVADHIAHLIRSHAKNSRAHVVGLSMGGFIAQRMAINHPDLVLSLFVTGAEPYRGVRRRIAHYPSVLFIVSWLILALPDALYWRYASYMGFRRHETLLGEMRGNCSLWMLREEFASIVRFTLEDVGKIRARTLMVAGGRQDDVGATALAGQVLKAREMGGRKVDDGSHAVVVRDALHAWDLQFSELFGRGVLAWVEQKPLPKEFVAL